MAEYMINNIQQPIDFQEDDVIQRTLQNAKNLLMCNMGEVAYDRYRGFDKSLLHLPMDEFRAELLPELDRIMMWEPDIEVIDADAYLLEDGTTYIEVKVDVLATEEDEE